MILSAPLEIGIISSSTAPVGERTQEFLEEWLLVQLHLLVYFFRFLCRISLALGRAVEQRLGVVLVEEEEYSGVVQRV